MAPEVIRQSGHGRQADIWSVGCTVYEMCTGKPPYYDVKDQVSALFMIASATSPPPLPEGLSTEAKDFLMQCFQGNPKDRPNATRLLEHPFLRSDHSRSNSPAVKQPSSNPSPRASPIQRQANGSSHGHKEETPSSPSVNGKHPQKQSPQRPVVTKVYPETAIRRRSTSGGGYVKAKEGDSIATL
jgi:serine/threonine protein kinase